MRPARPKSNRRKIIAIIVLLGLIVGGVAGSYVLGASSGKRLPGDFTLMVLRDGSTGQSLGPPTAWQRLSPSTNIILNGTSVRLAVNASANFSFNDFVRLKLTNPVPGVTAKFLLDTLNPHGTDSESFVQTGLYKTSLILTVASNVTTRELPYNFTITGTSVRGHTSHSFSFPLRLRATKIGIDLLPPPSGTKQESPGSLEVGKSPVIFTASVWVTDVYDIAAFQFSLVFNSSIIQILNNTNGRPTFSRVFLTPGTIIDGQDCSDTNFFNPPCDGFSNISALTNSTVSLEPTPFGCVAQPELGCISMQGLLLFSPCSLFVPCITSPTPQQYNIANVTFVSNSVNPGRTSLAFGTAIITELQGKDVIPSNTIYLVQGSVTALGPTTSVSCLPNPVTSGSQTVCTVTVTDTLDQPTTPTGTVSLTTGSSQSFSCNLIGVAVGSSSCQVTYTPTPVGTIGIDTVTVDYPGDGSHYSSIGSTTITFA